MTARLELARRAAVHLLLGFAVLSIVVSAGKIALRRDRAQASGGGGVKTVVYYMHASFRCETCDRIERMTHDFLLSRYAGQIGSGAIEWVSADFQNDTALAERFGVVSGCVVVARMDGGEVAAFRRLNEVWTLFSDPAAFNAYIDGAVREISGAAGLEAA